MYNKLFTKILDSSIWLEDDATRIVWITLLAAMNEDGFCRFASPANVALRARVPAADAVVALKKFEGPDPLTPEDENQGRRIERVPGGYIVLNAIRHREQVTREEIRRQDADRAKKYRERLKTPVTPNITLDRDGVTQGRDDTAPTKTDIEAPTPSGDTVTNVTGNRNASRSTVIRHAGNGERHGTVTQSVSASVSEAEAKQLQKQGRKAAVAFAKQPAEKLKKLVADAPSLVLPPWLDIEAWGSYLEMRKTLKKPATHRALELVLGKLMQFEAQGHNSTDILNESVVNGWTNVYAPKPAGGSNHGSNRSRNDARDTSGNAEAVQRVLDELAAQGNDDDNGGSDHGLSAGRGRDAGPEADADDHQDVPRGPERSDEGTEHPSLFAGGGGVPVLPEPRSFEGDEW